MTSSAHLTVLAALRAQLQRTPEATALVDHAGSCSLRQLWAGAQGVARKLAARDIEPGARIGLCLEPGRSWVQAWLGTLLHGAVVAPLPSGLPTEQLALLLDDLQASALIRADATVVPRTALPLRDMVLNADEAWAATVETGLPPATALLQEPGPEALAMILYTSGSRAQPKGVMLSHGNLAFTSAAIQSCLQLQAGDRVLCLLPPHHTYGLYQLLVALPAGATVILERAPALPSQLAERLAAGRITVWPTTPTLLSLLAGLREPQRHPLPHLRMITNAADALPVERIAWLRQHWPQAALWCMYGQTECGRASMLPPGELPRKAGSVGRGLPGTEAWLVDAQGRRVAGAGSGELVLRGGHVMQGYWRRPEETAEAFRADAQPPGQRALHTGDLFTRDADGCLHFLGRRGDFIKCRGERVSPREVEAALLLHPDIAECAVIGRPDRRLGQRIEAHVVCRPGAAPGAGALADHCRRHLLAAHCPQQFQFHAKLPKTELGKVATGRLPQCPPARGC